MPLELSDIHTVDCPCIVPTGAEVTRFGEPPLYKEGLYDLGEEVYAWMVPNGSWGESNAGLIVGSDSSLLVDTLWDHYYTRQMLDAMKECTIEAPITTLVNTHADGDHFWGNHLLRDVDIIASEASLNDMDHHVPKQMGLFRTVGTVLSYMPTKPLRQAGHWMRTMTKPYAFNEVIHTKAKRSFSGRMTLDIGGRQVELIEVGPAHRPGDAIVYVPDAKVLFSADILFIGCTPVMWQGPVENWIKALDLILDLDVEKIVPGHGPITNKDGVQQVKDYWEFVSKAARARYDEGKTEAEAAEEIIFSDEFRSKPFIKWDSPERMMTNCHTLYRHYRRDKKPMKPLQIINMMRKQAGLANMLPDASPRCMRS